MKLEKPFIDEEIATSVLRNNNISTNFINTSKLINDNLPLICTTKYDFSEVKLLEQNNYTTQSNSYPKMYSKKLS